MRHFLPLLLVSLAQVSLGGCAKGTVPKLEPIPAQTVAVGERLDVPLVVRNAESGLSFSFVGPDLPGLASTTSISGGSGGGLFRWHPLASHQGAHPFTFLLLDGGSEIDRQTTTVTVIAQADAAPVFVRPGAGGTYDLQREPCVAFDIEVRDADTLRVTIRERALLPEGAAVMTVGDLRAKFDWCPTPDQVTASQRWTIQLEADDGGHPPTPHDYTIVLRSGPKAGCPGTPPVVTLTSPAEGARVTSEPGFSVALEVTDDMGLRDAPLLYYTTTAPDDPALPDITTFEQMVFTPDGARWRGRVPPLGLADGVERTLYVVASAIDNDDPMGAVCDHRVDTALRTFIAVGTGAAAGLADCEPCTASAHCGSGICALGVGGARCLEACGVGSICATGTCGSETTTEGATSQACGTAPEACGAGSGPCTDDAFEENDSVLTAATAPATRSAAQVCSGDDDYFRVTATGPTRVSVTVDGFVHADGDLDLELLDRSGTILASSGGVTGTEQVNYCMAGPGEVYARVFGWRGAANSYFITATSAPGMCCLDDGGEPDDTRATARAVMGAFSGTVCPGDDDYLRFSVASAGTVNATLSFDGAAADLDLELYGPTGMLVASSRGVGSAESISAPVAAPGTYALRVYGYGGDSGAYTGMVSTSAGGGCTDTSGCPLGQVCDGGACVPATCSSGATCPTGHQCLVRAPPLAGVCAFGCTSDLNCRAGESCKHFPGGRFCGERGLGAPGSACTTFADCGGQRSCMPLTGGYCARAGCTTSADCETGTYCVTVGLDNLCALDCLLSDTICRPGYRCSLETDADMLFQFVCVP